MIDALPREPLDQAAGRSGNGRRPCRLFRIADLFLMLALVLTMFGVLSVDALAQRFDGSIRGTVKDVSGAIVPGATVTALNQASGTKSETITSSAGIFIFPNLITGSYTISVQTTGFKSFVRKDVAVNANQVTDANAVLEIGDVTTTIEVMGGGDLVSTTSSQVGGSIDERAVIDLPNPVLGGNPLNLALAFPNTTSQGGGVLGEGGAIGGNRPRNNNFTIDGVDNNDVTITGSLQPVIQDAVAEFNLITNQFSAEYGHSTAGQFNIVTKSGTNEIHSSAFYYGQNRRLNANDNLVNNAIRAGDLSGKPRYDFNRAGGTIGGPILKNRFFLFGAYEYSTQGLAATGVTVLAPTQSGLSTLGALAANQQVKDILTQLPTASSATSSVVVNGQTIPVGSVQAFAPDYYGQHDFQINPDLSIGSHQLRGRVLYHRKRQPNVNYDLPLAQFTGSIDSDGRKYGLTDVWTVSPSVVNDFRVSYARFIKDYRVPETFSNFPNVFIDDLGLTVGPEGNSPQSTIQNTYQVLDNVSYSKGRHQFKFGAEYRNWITPGDLLPRSRGEWDYTDLNELVNDLVPGGLNGALRGAGSGFFAGNQQALYGFAQDDFRLTSNLTLNLGLRYEFTTNPRDAVLQELNSIASIPGLFDFRNPKTDKNNFGPRVGFAYAPDVSSGWLGRLLGPAGRSSIRGGFGMAYDVVFQNLVNLQLPPQLQTEQNPLLTCASGTPPAWCASGRGFLAGGGLLQVNVPPTTAAEARSATQSLMTDQVAPKTMTWTLSFQREIGANWGLEARYLGTRAVSLPVQVRLNSITVFERNPGVVLPTWFSAAEIPGTMPADAPTREQFLNLQDLRYTGLGFDGGFVTAFPAIGNSSYHSGSVDLNRRFSRGLYVKANYTFSRTIDDSTNELFSSRVNPRRPQDSFDIRNERGLSTLDRPHKLMISWVYELPKFKSSNFVLDRALAGWQINGTYIAESGQPVTALSGIDANGNFDSAGDRALVNPSASALRGTGVDYVIRNSLSGATSVVSGTPDDALVVGYLAQDPTAKFVVAEAGTISTAGRNTVRAPGLNNWNLSLFRNVRVAEKKNVQFRIELFNAFNHRQYSLGKGTFEQFNDNALSTSYANVSAQNFLNSGQFSGGSRLIQYSMKLMF
jgi:hypothetical protein